jgi:hypothetical protein
MLGAAGGFGVFVSTTKMCLFVHSQNSTWELTGRTNSAALLHVGQVGAGGGDFSILPLYAHPVELARRHRGKIPTSRCRAAIITQGFPTHGR